jgi:uncharacterized protein YcsI (UPF0317 family)
MNIIFYLLETSSPISTFSNQDEDVVNVQSDFPDLCSWVHVDTVIKISHCCRECTLAFVVGCMQIL